MTEALAPIQQSAPSRVRVSRARVAIRLVYLLWTLAVFATPLALEAIRGRLARRGWLGPSRVPTADRMQRHGARLRRWLLALGPTFIKTGQMLATRADLLPVEVMRELALLHDQVPPFSDRQAFAIIERSTGRPLGDIFSEISEGPIAAASLGQVYRATLRATGLDVAVKVRRPGLARRVAVDMAVLKRVARVIESLEHRAEQYPWLTWLRGEWYGSVVEFERVISEEMNYRLEAASATRFRNNFASWSDVLVPRIVDEYTSERLIVMDFIEGTKVTDLDGLRARGLSPRLLNELLYRTYFKQLFEDGFFHADPHPGNLLVTRDGRLAFFDFGMSGVIDDALRGRIVTTFFHLLDRDIDGIVDDLFALEFLPEGADVTGLHDVVAEAFARRLEVKLSDVRLAEMVYDLAPVVYSYPFTTPARFTFLIRALMTLEGISVQMNPDFNFFAVAGPYARGFLLRKESATLRSQVLQSMRDASSGRLEWQRIWRIAKTAYTLYAGSK